MIGFTVPGEPRGKARARVTRYGTYIPETTMLYENLVKVEFANQCAGHVPYEAQQLAMTIKAYFSIPKSFSKAKRLAAERNNLRPIKKPDADNIGKILADALNGWAYKDDAQIVDLRVLKRYGCAPRVDVVIMPIGGNAP